jgi:hypothetical protein
MRAGPSSPRSRDDVAGGVGRHQEARDTFLAGSLVGDGEDDRHLRILAGGDELLDAVEDKEIAVVVGTGGDRGRVGAGMWLGQAEAAEHLAARQWLQPGFLLLVAAILHGDAAGQRVLHADDGRGGAVTGGDLFDHQHQRHVVHAGASPLFGDDHAERAEFAEFAQGFSREDVVAVPFGGEGRQAFLRKVAQRVADHFLFLCEDHAIFSLLMTPAARRAPA